MNRQAVFGEEAVVNQAGNIERLGVVPRHVRIAEHEVHIVHRVDATEQRT